MKISNKNIIIVCLFHSILFLNGAGATIPVTEGIVHRVAIAHPGKSVAMLSEKSLVEIQDETGISMQFYMDVESVYCDENVCKVVPVRITWNEIGQYIKYELDSGIQLEKAEGIPFTEDDYRQLHDILLDKRSIFNIVSIEDIVKKENIQGVVAVSGATLIS